MWRINGNKNIYPIWEYYMKNLTPFPQINSNNIVILIINSFQTMYEVHQQQVLHSTPPQQDPEQTYLEEDVEIERYPDQEAKMQLKNYRLIFRFSGLPPESHISIPITFDLKFKVNYSVPNNFKTHIKSFHLKDNNEIVHSFSADSEQKNKKIYSMLATGLFEDGFHDQYKGQRNEATQATYAKCILVTRTQNGIKYFVKAFSKKSLQSLDRYPEGNGRQAVLHEINILKKLNFPGLMKFERAYSSEKTVYMVNELITGANLLKVFQFREGNFTEKQIFLFMKKMLEVLCYLSSKRIFHRDIKPENIMIRNEEMAHPVLVDFGMADYCDNAKYCFKVGGTLGYLAPEIFIDKNVHHCHFQPVCDIFSLGIIFYMLIRRRPFFNGETDRQVKQANRNYTNQYLTTQLYGINLNENLKDLLVRMLQADPNKRITAQQALQHAYFDKQWNADEQRPQNDS